MDELSSGGAREGQGGAIVPGRQREGVPKEGGKRVVPAKGATSMTFAPRRWKPWRRHWNYQYRELRPVAAKRRNEFIIDGK
jgi:hypothetical protein